MTKPNSIRLMTENARAAFALAGALALVACANEVHDAYGDGGNNLGSCSGDNCPDETTSGGNVTPPPQSQAVAMLYSEIDWNVGSGSSSVSSTSSGGGIDPNTLYVFIDDQVASCSDPFAAMPCGSHWNVSIAIPPSLQQPGIIELSDPALMSSASLSGPGSGEDCWFGGGSYLDGTIEIVSIDSEEVVVRLAGTGTFEFDADGEYAAERCANR